MSTQKSQQQQRIIGRWTIGGTLGKGGYSWVKQGQDIKTGKIVALKFMEKADGSWVNEQAKQVETEIEALKNIRHQNVMKLYAYNLNAQYPVAKNVAEDIGHSSAANEKRQQQREYLDTILLVLEYAPGGELFDILYYTSALKPIVARTYFRQIISGLDACHSANVVHRDLKPQNLLLDAKYNLKITDFGLSKIITSDADAVMKTTYVGTRGYQAPELLQNKSYDLKCDIFSVGVILFILLAGYPPFEQASVDDKWFKPLIAGKVDRFWRAHQKSPIVKIPEAKDLLTRMLCNDPKQRIDMNGIKNHPFFLGEVLKQRELIVEIRERHKRAEAKRRQDVRKMKDLAHSVNPARPIPGIQKAVLKDWPKDMAEGVLGEYTFVTNKQQWYDIYNLIQEAVTGRGQGTAKFDFEKGILQCSMSVLNNSAAASADSDESKQEQAATASTRIEFDVEVFRSRYWAPKQEEALKDYDSAEVQQVLIVRITRTCGDSLTYNRIMAEFMLGHCASIIKGLPQWARNMERAEEEELADNPEAAAAAQQQNDDDAPVNDSYDQLLDNDSSKFQSVAVN